jgi:hypothetical protein
MADLKDAIDRLKPVGQLSMSEVEAEIDALDARLQALWARQHELCAAGEATSPRSRSQSSNYQDDHHRTYISARHVVIKRPVGAGFFGEVFEGSWRGIPVALKSITARSEAAAMEMLKESDLLEHLDHAHVLRFYGIVRGELPPSWPSNARVPCICTEFCHGGSLLERLTRTTDEQAADPGFWRSMATHARDAARGLEYLHAQGVMHRDLKAENLLLDQEGVVKSATARSHTHPHAPSLSAARALHARAHPPSRAPPHVPGALWA